MNPLSDVFEAASKKFLKASVKHGTFDLASDYRDFLHEKQAEVLDAIIYLAMFLLKLQTLQRKAETGQAAGQKKTP